jgi:hypothetical protein
MKEIRNIHLPNSLINQIIIFMEILDPKKDQFMVLERQVYKIGLIFQQLLANLMVLESILKTQKQQCFRAFTICLHLKQKVKRVNHLKLQNQDKDHLAITDNTIS